MKEETNAYLEHPGKFTNSSGQAAIVRKGKMVFGKTT